MMYPDTNPEIIRSQAEISVHLPDTSSEAGNILPPRVKKGETLPEMVSRLWRVEGHKPSDVARRAAQRGHTISAAYIEDLGRGKTDQPTPDKIKAIAAGFNLPLVQVIAVAYGLTLKELPIGLSPKEEAAFQESEWAELWAELQQLSPSKQREKRYLFEVLRREIQRDL